MTEMLKTYAEKQGRSLSSCIMYVARCVSLMKRKLTNVVEHGKVKPHVPPTTSMYVMVLLVDHITMGIIDNIIEVGDNIVRKWALYHMGIYHSKLIVPTMSLNEHFFLLMNYYMIPSHSSLVTTLHLSLAYILAIM